MEIDCCYDAWPRATPIGLMPMADGHMNGTMVAENAPATNIDVNSYCGTTLLGNCPSLVASPFARVV